MYKIKFFVSIRGDCPFLEFLEDKPDKIQAKIIKFLDLLSGLGPDLKRPYADVLRDGIRELRIRFGSDHYRCLYFFFVGHHIVVTHGFTKKTNVVPVGEIEKAIFYKKDFEDRYRRGDITL